MSTMDRILIVDDEANMRTLLEMVLTDEDYEVKCAASGEEALRQLEAEWFDLVLTDLKMTGMDGLALLRQGKILTPTTPYIMLTAHADIDSAVAAMKDGAFDYLTKPINQESLKLVVQKALEVHHLTREVEQLKAQVVRPQDFSGIIGRSKIMRMLLRQVKIVADSDATVLIQGESGTGKELIARALHQHSQRTKGPFIAVDCGTLPESLLESELFGYTKGAFTGAVSPKKGLFEEADGGTIFLDELGDTEAVFQSKLLRVLQEGEIRPVGSNRSIRVDVRVVAASNKDLKTEAEQGRFRSDLYYRLAVVPLSLPPLRERREDIPLLVEHFVEKYCTRRNRESKTVSAKAMQLLIDASWPGNVRELENVIERAVLFSPGATIQPDVLLSPSQLGEEKSSSPTLHQVMEQAKESVGKAERERIREAMYQAGENRSKAAKLLGISRSTLYEKLKRYNLLNEAHS